MLIAVTPVFGNGVVHKVSVGSPDWCYPYLPGCDANLSLEAIEFADGSVKGQMTDIWYGGYGLHAEIDCLVVEGNEAWISAVIKSGRTSSGYDLVGLRVNMRVMDNGTSENDPPDKLSGVYFNQAITCTDKYPLTLFDAPQGQVIVK